MVVSVGRLEVVTASFAWTVGVGTHLVQELLQRLVAVGLVLAHRHRDDDPRVELRDERRRARGAERPADRHAGDFDPADVGELLLGQLMADVAEMDRVDPVELGHERDLAAALRAPRVVAVRPHARQEDVVDLVLARPVEHERGLEAGRDRGAAVAREPIAFFGLGASSGWLNVITSPVMPRPVGPTTAG